MANKPLNNYTKYPFWPQNSIFGTFGSLEQFENFMKNNLIYKSVKTGLFLKSLNAPCVVNINLLLLVFTLKHQVLLQKAMIMLN